MARPMPMLAPVTTAVFDVSPRSMVTRSLVRVLSVAVRLRLGPGCGDLPGPEEQW
jgi:hypothetical protein